MAAAPIKCFALFMRFVFFGGMDVAATVVSVVVAIATAVCLVEDADFRMRNNLLKCPVWLCKLWFEWWKSSKMCATWLLLLLFWWCDNFGCRKALAGGRCSGLGATWSRVGVRFICGTYMFRWQHFCDGWWHGDDVVDDASVSESFCSNWKCERRQKKKIKLSKSVKMRPYPIYTSDQQINFGRPIAFDNFLHHAFSFYLYTAFLRSPQKLCHNSLGRREIVIHLLVVDSNRYFFLSHEQNTHPAPPYLPIGPKQKLIPNDTTINITELWFVSPKEAMFEPKFTERARV